MTTIPSPHQFGLAPRGVTAHLETFRGCPMTCMFCQWGAMDAGRTMTADALEAELRRFKEHDAKGVFIVDAGLNLSKRAFRALMEAEERVGFIEGGTLTCEIYPSLLEDEHLALLACTDAHVGLGLQSLDDATLKNVERPFDRRKFDRVVARVAEVAETSIELIVGLPGDNPQQFRRTLESALRLPVSVRVYHCLVLPDAFLTRAPPEFKLDFDPITLEMRSCLGWSEEELLETFDFLSEEVERRGGSTSRHYPRGVEAQQLSYHVGSPIVASMWSFNNTAHEELHRARWGVPEHDVYALQMTPRAENNVGAPRNNGGNGPRTHSPPRSEGAAEGVGQSGSDARREREWGGGEVLPERSRLAQLIAKASTQVSYGRWRVERVTAWDEELRIEIAAAGAHFIVGIAVNSPREAVFARTRGLAFWCESMPTTQRPDLERFVDLLGAASERVDLFKSRAPLRVVQ